MNQPSQPANFRTLIGVMVDGVVLQQNKAELIGLYAIARSGDCLRALAVQNKNLVSRKIPISKGSKTDL